MAVKFDITIGKGEQQYTKTVVIDPEELTLGFNEQLEEAQETKRWKAIIPVFAEFLGLTNDEVRAITNKQFVQMMKAVKDSTEEATTIPNG